jgi:predicted ATPase
MSTQQDGARARRSTSSKEALRFTHLHLENWRNFTTVDASLEKRAFIVGPNASGKSNLLDVFRFLRDTVAIGGGFQEAVRRRGGVPRLRCLAARRNPDVVIDVEIGSDEEGSIWQYELRFSQDKMQRPTIKRERVVRRGDELLSRPERADEADPQRLSQTFLEQVNVNQRFREVSDFLNTVRYLHVVPQLVREPDRSVGRANDPFGGDFLEQVAATPSNVQGARLRRIKDALTVAVPQLVELEMTRDTRGTPHLRGKYEHWRAQGAWQDEAQFSDGTLRLLGLLWATLDGAGPLLLEEPELSLHPEVVRHLPSMFARIQKKAGRQIIVSTHSKDLLTDPGIGIDEVLLLMPGQEGTTVQPASAYKQVRALLDGDLSMGEAVMPLTRPERAQQLSLFGES